MSQDSREAWGLGHEPVMLREILEYLAPGNGGRFLDLTVGAGGHARAILERIGRTGQFVGMDRDEDVLRLTADRLKREFPQARFFHGDFAEIAELRRQVGSMTFQGVLLDLGVSSIQLDDAPRGFSFQRSGPLDMRMDRSEQTTAADLINRLSQGELERLIRTYGEERHARRIARAIVEERRRRPLTDTLQLASLIERAVPRGRGRINPATRTFQALRMAVNDEPGRLDRLLGTFHQLLERDGTIAVIAFQSLEDRAVKRRFREGARGGWLEVLTGKPVTPTDEEVARNRRSRSAKLRAARMIAHPGEQAKGE